MKMKMWYDGKWNNIYFCWHLTSKVILLKKFYHIYQNFHYNGKYIKLIKRLSNFNLFLQYDYKFVSKHKVSSYKVRLLNATVSENTKTLQKDFFLNCDGEVIRITEPEFDVKLHKKAVRIFGNASGWTLLDN